MQRYERVHAKGAKIAQRSLKISKEIKDFVTNQSAVHSPQSARKQITIKQLLHTIT
jgi:hypothetical protein